MMEFKYLANHLSNTLHCSIPVICDACNTEQVCHLPYYGGLTRKHGAEFIEQVCYECIDTGKLLAIETILCAIDQTALFERLKKQFPKKKYDEILELKDQIQPNIESRTPQLKTLNEYWPVINNDFAQFIGFASQAFLMTLSKEDGQAFFSKYRHRVANYFSWKELPVDSILGIEEALKLGTVLHVFKSTSSEEYCIL